MKPVIKWVGGKRLTADFIVNEINKKKYNNYFEPFLGGGAIFLKLQPKKANLSDINNDLINMYNVIKYNPIELMEYLDRHFCLENKSNKEDFYYKTREEDRDEEYNIANSIYKAARFIFLNKTCFNGIYRVNKKGQFNVPYGHYKNVNLYTKENIDSLSKYFNEQSIQFNFHDYLTIEEHVKSGDVVYFDPPYDVEKNNSEFVNYDKKGFNRNDQKELKSLCDRLISKGARVLVSNSHTNYIVDLYKNDKYNIYTIKKKNVYRSVSASSKSRKKYGEVLIVGENK